MHQKLRDIVPAYEPRTEKRLEGGKPIFVAYYVEIPLCIAEGDTAEIALKNLTEVIAPFLERLYQDLAELPEPLSGQRRRTQLRFDIVGSFVVSKPSGLSGKVLTESKVAGVSPSFWGGSAVGV